MKVKTISSAACPPSRLLMRLVKTCHKHKTNYKVQSRFTIKCKLKTFLSSLVQELKKTPIRDDKSVLKSNYFLCEKNTYQR